MVSIVGPLARRYYEIMNYDVYPFGRMIKNSIEERTVVRKAKELREKGDIKRAKALEELLEEFWSFYP
ncbi:MAG: hypothetical protein ACFFDN_20840 [Candidatus Hodarchaeota archaeon]